MRLTRIAVALAGLAVVITAVTADGYLDAVTRIAVVAAAFAVALDLGAGALRAAPPSTTSLRPVRAAESPIAVVPQELARIEREMERLANSSAVSPGGLPPAAVRAATLAIVGQRLSDRGITLDDLDAAEGRALLGDEVWAFVQGTSPRVAPERLLSALERP